MYCYYCFPVPFIYSSSLTIRYTFLSFRFPCQYYFFAKFVKCFQSTDVLRVYLLIGAAFFSSSFLFPTDKTLFFVCCFGMQYFSAENVVLRLFCVSTKSITSIRPMDIMLDESPFGCCSKVWVLCDLSYNIFITNLIIPAKFNSSWNSIPFLLW